MSRRNESNWARWRLIIIIASAVWPVAVVVVVVVLAGAIDCERSSNTIINYRAPAVCWLPVAGSVCLPPPSDGPDDVSKRAAGRLGGWAASRAPRLAAQISQVSGQLTHTGLSGGLFITPSRVAHELGFQSVCLAKGAGNSHESGQTSHHEGGAKRERLEFRWWSSRLVRLINQANHWRKGKRARDLCCPQTAAERRTNLSQFAASLNLIDSATATTTAALLCSALLCAMPTLAICLIGANNAASLPFSPPTVEIRPQNGKN